MLPLSLAGGHRADECAGMLCVEKFKPGDRSASFLRRDVEAML